MTRREPVAFLAIKLALWVSGTALFFRFLLYLLSFIGEGIHELWMLVASVSSVFFIFWGWLLWQWHLPGYKASDQSGLPLPSADTSGANAIPTTKDATTMPDKPHIYIDKIMNVNHGTINQNTPGGMMNLGPVTVNQNFGSQQTAPESAQVEPGEAEGAAISDDATIDINSLVAFSVKLKSPGISRNTIDSILKKANIRSCATEKDGRTIRNLYPREKSQAAIASYLADRDK